MITIAAAVRELVNGSSYAQTGIINGTLNFSAYAALLQDDVEAFTKKQVELGAIIAALSRLSREYKAKKDVLRPISAKSIAITGNLFEVTVAKDPNAIAKVAHLYSSGAITVDDFYTITQGVAEISIIAAAHLEDIIMAAVAPLEPKLLKRKLAALTIHHDNDYINQPNMYYSIIDRLAVRRINIVEFVSTYTESTFILEEEDVDTAFSALRKISTHK